MEHPLDLDLNYLLPIVFAFAMFGIWVLAYWLGTRPFRHVAWSIRNANLVDGGRSVMAGLSVAVNHDAIESMSIARIALWNLRRTDLKNESTWRIEAKSRNTRILSAKTIQTNMPSGDVQLRVSPSHNQVDILMLPLMSYQGAVLQVVHSGTVADDICVRSDQASISLRHYPPAAVYLKKVPVGNATLVPWWRRSLVIIGIILTVGVAVAIWLHPLTRIPALGNVFTAWDFAASIAVIGSFTSHWLTRPKTFKRTVSLPQGLDRFLDEG